MKHRNIPFFVPHAGCPNNCAFCSQTKITGQAERNIDEELSELCALLDSVQPIDHSSKIAFFGGSFTAIAEDRMIALLSLANEYIKKGVADGIRISTRPDCVDRHILDILREYRVTNIELGIQSIDDSVLTLSGRGHTAEDSFRAAELIKEYGFILGGQMMVGLPGSDIGSEIRTAGEIVRMGAGEARIYPTVVFEDTPLYGMVCAGKYEPLTDEEAVERCAACYKIFADNGVRVLRIGLHASEALKKAPFGATHPAIGELVKGRVLSDRIIELAGECKGKMIEISVCPSQYSMICGHSGAEINRIKRILSVTEITVTANKTAGADPWVRIRSV